MKMWGRKCIGLGKSFEKSSKYSYAALFKSVVIHSRPLHTCLCPSRFWTLPFGWLSALLLVAVVQAKRQMTTTFWKDTDVYKRVNHRESKWCTSGKWSIGCLCKIVISRDKCTAIQYRKKVSDRIYMESLQKRTYFHYKELFQEMFQKQRIEHFCRFLLCSNATIKAPFNQYFE